MKSIYDSKTKKFFWRGEFGWAVVLKNKTDYKCYLGTFFLQHTFLDLQRRRDSSFLSTSTPYEIYVIPKLIFVSYRQGDIEWHH